MTHLVGETISGSAAIPAVISLSSITTDIERVAQEAIHRDLSSREAAPLPPVSPISSTDPWAFHKACKQGDFARMVTLFNSETPLLDARDPQGFTPLDYACEHGPFEMVEFLLNQAKARGMDIKAFVNRLDNQGYTPLHAVIARNANTTKLEKVQQACAIAKLLLDHGAEVDPKTPSGTTPLLLASGNRSKELMLLLLDYGADIDHQDADGNTPLLLACYKKGGSLGFLLARGPKVNLCNKAGESPLCMVCSRDNAIIMEELLAAGADPDLGIYNDDFDKKKRFSPLMLAIDHRQLGMVKNLVKAGANMDKVVRVGDRAYTPFSFACSIEDNLDVVQFLAHKDACSARARVLSISDETRIVDDMARSPRYEPHISSPNVKMLVAVKKLALANSIGNKENAPIEYEKWYTPVFYNNFGKIIKKGRVSIAVAKTAIFRAFGDAASPKRNPVDLAASIQRGNLVIIPAGWKKHAISLIFCKGYLAIVNRGEGSGGYSTAEFYRIDPQKVDAAQIEAIREVSTDRERDEGVQFYYDELPRKLSPAPNGEIRRDQLCMDLRKQVASPLQEVGNCPYASAEGALSVAQALAAFAGRAELTPDPVKMAEVLQTSQAISLKIRLDYLEKGLANLPEAGLIPATSTLINEAWDKVKNDVSNNPRLLDGYPLIKRRLLDRDNARPIYKKAVEAVGTRLEAVRAKTLAVVLASPRLSFLREHGMRTVRAFQEASEMMFPALI